LRWQLTWDSSSCCLGQLHYGCTHVGAQFSTAYWHILQGSTCCPWLGHLKQPGEASLHTTNNV
jgi:hypothetical protein